MGLAQVAIRMIFFEDIDVQRLEIIQRLNGELQPLHSGEYSLDDVWSGIFVLPIQSELIFILNGKNVLQRALDEQFDER